MAKSVRLSKATHKRLWDMARKLAYEQKKNFSAEDTINYLIDFYESVEIIEEEE